MNDLADCVTSYVYLFADGTKIFRVIINKKDREDLQTRNVCQYCITPAVKSLTHLVSCEISWELLKDTYYSVIK